MFVAKVLLNVSQLLGTEKFLKSNVKLKLDLTKNSNKIFTKAIETVKNYDNVNYVMVDINCWLKVVFKDGSGKCCTDIMTLKEILEKEGINQV